MAGAVILARHGEPALSRRVILTAAGYREWWARYEQGGLKAGQAPPPSLLAITRAADTVVSSTRERSIQSARAIAEGRDVRSDPLFVEAPLPSPLLPAWFRLSPRWWGVLSRFCWWAFNFHDGQESRAEAEARARQAAKDLADRAAAGEEVVLVAHGFFNAMIGRALAARGWRKTLDQGFRYWSARRFEPPR
ncbi:MAG TPA: histidine phosphatase family protein [Caulobacteraceae bacterium]|jgi:broad specificity phosphatase PhoE|nr:histidine phosphatase family protein [Caulobacteraceae bacterium]